VSRSGAALGLADIAADEGAIVGISGYAGCVCSARTYNEIAFVCAIVAVCMGRLRVGDFSISIAGVAVLTNSLSALLVALKFTVGVFVTVGLGVGGVVEVACSGVIVGVGVGTGVISSAIVVNDARAAIVDGCR
jgi:hypothetical protein